MCKFCKLTGLYGALKIWAKRYPEPRCGLEKAIKEFVDKYENLEEIHIEHEGDEDKKAQREFEILCELLEEMEDYNNLDGV